MGLTGWATGSATNEDITSGSPNVDTTPRATVYYTHLLNTSTLEIGENKLMYYGASL
jgi:hypothetical protein